GKLCFISQVISQDPASGRAVRKGREISVVVSLGPEMIDVPDLTGQSLRDVNVLLANLKLKPGKITKKKASKAEPGHVISQNPPAGTKINKGKKIDLVISEGSEPLVRVPNWRSKPLEAVKKSIEDLDLKLDQVTWVWSEDVQKGTVISQSLESGSLVSPGSFISLEASAGRKEDEQVAMKQAQVSFIVPEGSPPLEVKVTLTDTTGTFVIYKSKHSPGETIDLTVSSIGDGEVLFYINNQVQKRVRI
ncbi:MAG: PASTA domain-containing protein, partial [Firmicutes bacterium]|nr:PASTA domain-containing protein [Bacillota bacterium]